MSRVQLALRVADLEASVTFYSKLFGVEPAKRRPSYTNFAIIAPPLKLVLIEGEPVQNTCLDHLGVEVETTNTVEDLLGRPALTFADWAHDNAHAFAASSTNPAPTSPTAGPPPQPHT